MSKRKSRGGRPQNMNNRAAAAEIDIVSQFYRRNENESMDYDAYDTDEEMVREKYGLIFGGERAGGG